MELTLKTKIPFGKYKGEIVENLLAAKYDIDANNLYRNRIPYFNWLERETQHTLSKDIKDRLEEIHLLRMEFLKRSPECNSSSSSYFSNLDHYNDMGAMNGISFQEIYGDFGY